MPGMDRRTLLTAAGAIGAGTANRAEARARVDATEPRFGLGTVTYNVPKDWDLPTLLAILPKAGVRAIEFRTTHRHGVEPGLDSAGRVDVKQRCADAGIAQLSLGTVCEFQSPDPAVVRQNVEACREWVRLAHDIGARGVKVRPNGLPKDVPVAKTLDQIGGALRECGRFAEGYGVEIWVEVHGEGTQAPENMHRIIQACGHPSVGVNWNSNPTDVTEGSVREAFRLLRPHLMSVHINNLWGDYPYRELFRLLRRSGYDRYTLCEVGATVQPADGLLFFQCYHGLWRELARG
jgi:sugar phosphate isomerase/epimerase